MSENRCRRCGETLDKKNLRCEYCIKLVDEELEGKISRPFNFYFAYYQENGRTITRNTNRPNSQIHRKSHKDSRRRYGGLR